MDTNKFSEIHIRWSILRLKGTGETRHTRGVLWLAASYNYKPPPTLLHRINREGKWGGY